MINNIMKVQNNNPIAMNNRACLRHLNMVERRVMILSSNCIFRLLHTSNASNAVVNTIKWSCIKD